MKAIRFLFALISIGNITLFASDKVFSCNYLQNKDKDIILLSDTIVLNSTIRTFCNKPFDVVSKKNVIVFKQVIFNQTKDTLTLDINTIDGYIIPVFPREIAPLSISVVDYYYSVIMPSREENTLIYLNFKKKRALEASDYRYTIYLIGHIEKQ